MLEDSTVTTVGPGKVSQHKNNLNKLVAIVDKVISLQTFTNPIEPIKSQR